MVTASMLGTEWGFGSDASPSPGWPVLMNKYYVYRNYLSRHKITINENNVIENEYRGWVY